MRDFRKNHVKEITLFIALLLGLLLHPWAKGAERFEFYNGIRALGMGGAAIAVVNDETALLYNPAGLGKLRNYIVTVADPEVDIGADTESIAGTNLTKVIEPQEALNMAKEHPGDRIYLRGQAFPSFVVPNFGIGVFKKYEVSADVDEASTRYRLDYINDTALVLGFNFRMWDGRIKLGFNTRIVNRIEIHRDDIDPNSSGLTLDGLGSEGIGVASDVGLMVSAPWTWLPTLAVVARDVGHTQYNFKEGLFTNSTTDPAVVGQSLDAAIALFPIVGKKTRAQFTAEYRGVLTASDEEDSQKRIHTGIEFNIQDTLFVRAGMNQRYWTAGFEIALMNYQLQFATYGEEVGTAAANQEERRYVGKFSYRF